MDITHIRSASLFYFPCGGEIAASQLLVIITEAPVRISHPGTITLCTFWYTFRPLCGTKRPGN